MGIVKKTISQLAKKTALAMTDLLPIAAAESNELKSASLQQIMDLLNTTAISDETKTQVQKYIEQHGIETPDVIDALTSTRTDAALSAAQGKALNDSISAIDVPAVVDVLTSTSKTDALSAAQGRALNLKIPGIADSLTSTSATQALAARQGKVLNDKLDKIKIVGGTTTCSYSTSTTGVTTAVKFSDYGNVTFSTAPTVVLSPVFSSPDAAGYIPADSITTTGFNVYLRHPSASGSTQVQWIAISMG